ncbi:hypothetical protein ANOM_001516 [Aspergillus nomiae NRRL 13137]|uniref:Zn(2)-C6 fungal-type domain-containing protein n=1 Tax=Aspergillus nomiae NRRL (strain ATCC 15546 / NRRL 13137 / CBS 260.88 / M93) TaxID=1509407 RepID=A0A0L1JFP1_ASPN3|nr:uncharacterized protein ANOM_001516 [Aspergillus nomiae NRRL 13137]KNG90580.1 hypothetical protein ANOM_001516 [Aspergillus nomiae NRRL 13137]
MDRPPPAKRPRLSMACNICRQRKVKCDAEYPKCRNCRIRNQICVTTDPQRPGVPGVREWLEMPEKINGNTGTQCDGLQKEPTCRQNDQTSPPNTSPQQQPQSQEGQPSPSVGDNLADEKVNEFSPVHQPFDTSLNVERGTNRMKILGGSSSQCLAKSLDVYFEAARLKPVSASFGHGMRHAEELDMPLTLSLPGLPGRDCRDRYARIYLARIHPTYPIFSPNGFRESMEQLSTVADYTHLPRDNVPILVLVYLVMGLGSDEEAQSVTEVGEKYLQAAAGLVSHLVAIPYLPTVQALLLLTLMYRGRNQEGLAWQTLGMAIRIAYTLGIHRPQTGSALSTSHSTPDERHLPSQIWAVCCCLERMMQLQCGRPASISAEHLSTIGSLTCQSPYLQWSLGLAEYQGNISQHIYNYHPGSRNVRQILLDTARLDRLLLSWANVIPPELRPGNDIFCPDEEYHMAAYLSIQFHETLITLHRAALIAPTANFDREIEKHCADEPSKFRMRNGESICVNSARAIAKLSIELSERGTASRLIPVGPSLLACIVLAIYLMKNPRSRLQTMDLELLKLCLENCRQQLARCNSDPRFMEGLAAMYDQIVAHHRVVSTSAERRHTLATTYQSDQHPHKASTWPPRNHNQQHTASNIAISQNPSNYTIPHSFLTPATYDDAPAMNNIGHASCSEEAHAARAPLFDYLPTTGKDQPHNQGDAGLHDTGSLIDQLTSSGDGSNEVDRLFPFEGYNVEDLWNWMLYFDGPQSA